MLCVQPSDQHHSYMEPAPTMVGRMGCLSLSKWFIDAVAWPTIQLFDLDGWAKTRDSQNWAGSLAMCKSACVWKYLATSPRFDSPTSLHYFPKLSSLLWMKALFVFSIPPWLSYSWLFFFFCFVEVGRWCDRTNGRVLFDQRRLGYDCRAWCWWSKRRASFEKTYSCD